MKKPVAQKAFQEVFRFSAPDTIVTLSTYERECDPPAKMYVVRSEHAIFDMDDEDAPRDVHLKHYTLPTDALTAFIRTVAEASNDYGSL
jgi:hypothetical protein